MLQWSLVLLSPLLLLRSLILMVFPSVLASLLLASPDVPVVSSAAVAPPVTVLAVARGLYHGVPDVVVTAVASHMVMNGRLVALPNMAKPA